MKISVTTRGFGRAVIERKGKKIQKLKKDEIYISQVILDKMEIKAESIFRPHQKNVETIYALAGKTSIHDRLYTLSTNAILYDSGSMEVRVDASQMLEHIMRDDEKIGLLIFIHTHPEGIPEPSKDDLKFFKHVSSEAKKHFPGMVLYGVHAINNGEIRNRTNPYKTRKNVIKWSSSTHDHEVGFYNNDGKWVNVII
ncbi:MAG: hypothetical protein A7315_06800 [Candidatus Altiarchaeales archaeon WOR_SM1_79]|nr:MAG: hypothetical protein A7315_06800 [Candidatus Altiarchaeales archaeon WOR_SM1_79]